MSFDQEHFNLPENLHELVFRTSPVYKLEIVDRLGQAEKESVTSLVSNDPTFYGILCPSGEASGTIKTVCQKTALLLYTLREPAKAPSYLSNSNPREALIDLWKLVLDGILEVEISGRFISGPEAAAKLKSSGARHQKLNDLNFADSYLASLSINALKYAQSLEINEAISLSTRLYAYNRYPNTAKWYQFLQNDEDCLKFLGVGYGSKLANKLKDEWQQSTMAPPNNGWFVWKRKSRKKDKSSPDRIRYKLYISPSMSDTATVLRESISTLAEEEGVSTFKVGKGSEGLLRPDKMVAYFASFESLAAVEKRLFSKLEGAAVQGTPFTADFSSHGLTSWGQDPPASDHLTGWLLDRSWRTWIASRLASGIIAARTSPACDIEPWEFALEKIELLGVDLKTWSPKAEVWSGQ